MCRSARLRTKPLPIKPETSPHCVIPTVAQAEWRNPPRWIMNHHKIKLATQEDSSTRILRSPRNDMSGGGSVHPHGLYLPRCLAMNHRRCIAWFHSTARIVFATSHRSVAFDCSNLSFLFRQRKMTPPKRVRSFSLAEKEGFEPSIPFWGIHDFQSCALGQLRDFSMRNARFMPPVDSFNMILQKATFVK